MACLFAYGSLMCADIMQSVAGGGESMGKAVLPGYVRLRVQGETYPAVVPRVGASTDGVLYQDLDDRAFGRLDKFEGEMYRRERLTVLLENGRSSSAQVYVFRAEFLDRLAADAWCFDEFLKSGKSSFVEAYFGFSRVRDDD